MIPHPLPARRVLAMLALGTVAIALAIALAVRQQRIEPTVATAPATTQTDGSGFAYTPPDPSTIPVGPVGDAIRRGRDIVTRTYETLPDHVGNELHCTSCHLEGGTKAGAAPWVGLLSVFPEYRARSGRVDPIERRVNDCFERSMDGRALDPQGDDMTAILAYIGFISRGVPAGTTPGRGFRRAEAPPTPDRAHGAEVYAAECASCHGAAGEGKTNQDAYLFPPVGGPESFNLGAGMARLDTAASFVRWNMPLGRGGSLSEADAYAVADFVIHMERPDWAGRAQDWPAGGRPRDARY